VLKIFCLKIWQFVRTKNFVLKIEKNCVKKCLQKLSENLSEFIQLKFYLILYMINNIGGFYLAKKNFGRKLATSENFCLTNLPKKFV